MIKNYRASMFGRGIYKHSTFGKLNTNCGLIGLPCIFRYKNTIMEGIATNVSNRSKKVVIYWGHDDSRISIKEEAVFLTLDDGDDLGRWLDWRVNDEYLLKNSY
jgi:hypothetical protein